RQDRQAKLLAELLDQGIAVVEQSGPGLLARGRLPCDLSIEIGDLLRQLVDLLHRARCLRVDRLQLRGQLATEPIEIGRKRLCVAQQRAAVGTVRGVARKLIDGGEETTQRRAQTVRATRRYWKQRGQILCVCLVDLRGLTR